MRTKKAIEEWLRSEVPWKEKHRVGAVTVDWMYVGDRLCMRTRLIRQKKEYDFEKHDVVTLNEAELSRPSYYFVNSEDWITEGTGLAALVDMIWLEERAKDGKQARDRKGA